MLGLIIIREDIFPVAVREHLLPERIQPTGIVNKGFDLLIRVPDIFRFQIPENIRRVNKQKGSQGR